MNKQTAIVAAPEHPLAMLRKDFPANQISKLPKETRAQIDARKADKTQMVFNCQICGGHHHKAAVHLDYVGHAALTDRLLDTDIEWTWEPVAFDASGLPAFDANRGLWIKLTVGGVTRLGYGSADGKAGGDAVKEIIGDALRNAAMRFGAALDLWHKGDLHVDADSADAAEPEQAEAPPVAVMATDAQRDMIQQIAAAVGKPLEDICKAYKVPSLKGLTQTQAEATIKRLQTLPAREPVDA